jgi:signal transduction histidine kinase
MGLARVLLSLEEGDRPVELVRTLRDAGMDPEVAKGADTIARLASGPCDVLVGPAPIPGRGVLREAKGLFPDLEIVAVLEADAAAQAPACLRAGACDLVLSPVVPAHLVDAVSRALERRRARGLAREHHFLALQAALGQFSAAVAHDIANPVSVLLAACGAMAQEIEKLGEFEALLRDGAPGARSWWQASGRAALREASAIADDAAAATHRLNQLAHDLRLVSRSDPSRLAPVEVAGVVEMVQRMVRSMVSGHAAIEAHVTGGLRAWANAGALALAISQLVVLGAGANRAAAAAEKVRVRAAAVGPQVTVDIAPGSLADEGMAGVAMARDLVEAQGGALYTCPGPAGGGVFRIALRSCDA